MIGIGFFQLSLTGESATEVRITPASEDVKQIHSTKFAGSLVRPISSVWSSSLRIEMIAPIELVESFP
jgi:hypothetical protein